jgi:hypothetical protein
MSESEEIRWRVGGAEEAGQVEEAAVLAEEDDEEHKKEELQQRANLGHALRFIPHKKEESDQKFIRNILDLLSIAITNYLQDTILFQRIYNNPTPPSPHFGEFAIFGLIIHWIITA